MLVFWFWLGLESVGNASIESGVVADRIRAGLQPPVEVACTAGFEYQAEQSRAARAAYFETHEFFGGAWKLRTEPFGGVTP